MNDRMGLNNFNYPSRDMRKQSIGEAHLGLSASGHEMGQRPFRLDLAIYSTQWPNQHLQPLAEMQQGSSFRQPDS